MKSFTIPAQGLTCTPPEDTLKFKDTSQVSPLTGVIGQKRAVDAIDFGLNMKGAAYNIFVTGLDGTGRSTIVRQLLDAHAATEPEAPDLCMVNNFDDAYCPVAIEMPPGTAVHFAMNMARFLEILKIRIPRYFETPGFRQEQEKLVNAFASRHQAWLDSVGQEAGRVNLGIQRTEQGWQVIPMGENDQPMEQEAFDSLAPEVRQKLEAAVPQVEQLLNDALVKINASAEAQKQAIKSLVAEKTDALIAEQIDPVRYYFRECADIMAYLNRVKEDIIENIAMFIGVKNGGEDAGQDFSQMAGSLAKRYQVNVLVDRRGQEGAPVVFEPNPTFGNLFGKIEKKPDHGTFVTDFTMVQAGALLKASGGYLVMNIEPLLMNPSVWELFKQTLQKGRLQIEDMPDQADYGMPSLKPAPIPVDVKVILIGGYDPFRRLQAADPRFNKIFKVRADFDYEADLTPDRVGQYAGFVARVCDTEGLRPFTPQGVWAVIRHASRMADRRDKVSLRFGSIRGLLMEADFWARKAGADTVDRDHVITAVRQYRTRHNLYEEKVMAQFEDDSVLLDVAGAVVGQVNALAVYDMGDIAFGRPTRITAESYMGKPGIINVEHESELSGQTHDKGVMILSGYLGRIFAQAYPLSVSVSITFEQSYDGVDGDSASSTELYAVLSSLSDVPIRQDIAVTGSVNQKGEIQAIGGVNEKIEGFFDICSRKGLTGTQGVMIPASNVNNLVLRDAVVRAMEQGQFHIWAVSRIEEGIEVLTGMAAGRPNEEGTFLGDTLFGRVQKKLGHYHQLSLNQGL